MRRLALACVGVLCLAGCVPQAPSVSGSASSAAPSATAAVRLVSPAGTEIPLTIEIANTPLSREQGLMYRDHLADGAGMLFVFDSPQTLSFWMKNTIIPLDVLFFAEDGTFVSVQTMTPCLADPCATYPSGQPASFALEVNAGFAKANAIGKGWELRRPK